ncbi:MULTISPECIES: glycosyltransferase family protein [Streptomyces]|uniref:Uncharacterized protein n=1 Tax=Streptomyces xanthochromogenes TaxID=67384 RepID=A0ABQ2ZDT1_9ACTN|nr:MULTISPECIES: hypothetical protein [Streptomyces]MYV88668.1 hypothetical protein [Streptomyces sp. SID1034]GGY13684.1 hypothetical protein GCM10010326_01220 [Streptomyces xanthochromogenes]
MTGHRDTVILPLAGRGTRLGLPTPKELLPIGPGRVALDDTLDLLAPHTGRLRLVAVLGPDREPTARYLERRCHELKLPLAVVRQDPGLPESTGAVLGAAPWYGPATVVLLADQILNAPAPKAVGETLDLIHAGHEAVFLAAMEDDAARLAADGALHVQRETGGLLRVTDYADKPGLTEADRFNAVWFGYAFAARAAEGFTGALHRATLGLAEHPHQMGAVLRAVAVEVGPFTDLGTWPAVTAHWAGAAS